MKKYYKGYIQHLTTSSKLGCEEDPDDIPILDMLPGVYVVKLRGKDEYSLCNGKFVNSYFTNALTCIKTNINEHLYHNKFDYYVVEDDSWHLEKSIVVKDEIDGGFVCLNNLMGNRYIDSGYHLTTGNYRKLRREGYITEIDHTSCELGEGLILLVHKPCVLETEHFDYHFNFVLESNKYKDFTCEIIQK